MEYIFYGAGAHAKYILKRCRIAKIEDIILVDSDKGKWGSFIYGYQILEPSKALFDEADEIIVTTLDYKEEVFKTLTEKYNVSASKIFYIDDKFIVSECLNMGNIVFNEEKYKQFQGQLVAKEIFDDCLDENSFNDFEKFFFLKNHRSLVKWGHYFEAYDRYFSKFRKKEKVRILEIGVANGGSLQMWKDYFGNNVEVYGVDICESCKELEEERISIYIGSQEDRDFLKEIKMKIGMVDIILDDGGHSMNQQITSFEELFDIVADDGIYVCEDTHTCFMSAYQDLEDGNTFIEYTKKLIDGMHSHYVMEDLEDNLLLSTIKSISYFDSMVFIEKRKSLSAFLFLDHNTMIIENITQ